MMPTPEDDQGNPKMIYLQNWIDQVNPMAALPR